MSHHSLEGFTSHDSDHIDGSKYDSMEKKLTVRFKNGYQYAAHDMSPEEYQAFLDASSQGSHWHSHIKGNYHITRVK